MKKITVIGAGPVGLAFAILHASAEQPVTLIDQNCAEVALKDPRSLALSYGSVQILTQLGVDFATFPSAAIKHIHISEQGAWGHTQLHYDEQNVPQLGAVVRYGDLVQQLNAVASTNPHIEFIRPALVKSVEDLRSHALLNLTVNDADLELKTELLIHAEGGVFSTATDHSAKDYQQTALIANIALATPQIGWAWERFTAQGPCALLPASNDGLTFNLVWCVERSAAADLLNADDAHCLELLNGVLAHLSGKIVAMTPRQHFPLGLKQMPDLSSTCRTTIGNAAQTLHPVAGQGFNLGLRDAFVLHQKLNSQKNIAQALSEFSQARRKDRAATIAITDKLASNFSVFPSLKHLRSLGFGLMNFQPWLKKRIANQFMYGFRD